ncbi:Macrophage mannose receptor 1 [Holothuria leucospilota]|uniref:Macrophage mannose receptor 1 n=1 Tax=Holothuria leucospilota TaxID=206669 RepID=A0A9Q1C187_HOLLE|nr:Macrophage mannose receptor 1 [Holothuria leucospilota]
MAYKGAALIVLWTFAFVSIVSSQTCSSGWSYITGRCYKQYEVTKSWYEARQACQNHGGDLAVIKSTDLQNALTLMLFGQLGSYWIGLQYNATASDFIWIDSTPLDPSVARWSPPDEPNNVGNGEDCVEMYGTTGLWNDAACGSGGKYICERRTDVLKKCDEDNGWVSATDKCYKFYNDPQNWEGAKTYCRKVDGDLVDVNSAEEQNVVTATSLSGNTFWIGLTNKDYSADVYMWSTGAQLTYTNWGTNEPASRHFNEGGDCAEVLDTATKGEWNTAKCTDSKGFMCERNQGTCPSGWRIHKGNCYQFNSNMQLTYTDAKHICEAQGTFLVSIFSGEENDYIVSQFEDLVNIGINDIWIGMADYPTDGVFIWSDNSAVTYTNWKQNEPFNSPTQHDCGMILTDSNGQWNTDNCFGLKAYVCKVRAGQSVYPISPNLPVGVCPAGWNLYRDSCYYSDTSQLNWNSAETYCTNQNAHLVAINDEDEQSYISMRVAGIGVDTWIGLHDTGNRDNYVWTDGSSLDIDNWADGNPNYPPSGEACVAAKAQDSMEGQWDDMGCTTNKPYICEKPKACETLTTYSTDTNFYYRYHPSPLPSNRVEFEVKAESDVHVSLTSSNTGQGQMYEIIIGGWTNTQSVIRLCGSCKHETEVSTVGILSGSEFRGFWITYESDGYISVGKYGEGIPFMEWTDPNPFTVSYIGYSTGYGFQGEFKFCNLDAGSSQTGSILPTAAFDPRCGTGWEYDSMTGNCYLFKPNSYKSWADAEFECNKGGGNLVSISGLEEMSYINSRLVLITESLLWIGGTDASREGGWMWSDNSAFRYLNWASGEPNNAGEEGEHCAEMYVSSGMWNDVDCNKALGYICKKNGYLVDHFTVQHNMYIDGYDNLQLSDTFPEDCAEQCVQQTAFTCRSFEYNTETMQCSLSDASVVFSGAQLSYVENVDYYERPVEDQCIPGWDLFQSKCYFFDKYAKKTWYEARSECQEGGGDLALSKTQDVNQYLLSQIVSFDGYYWFGLHDLSDEGDFEWVDGTKLIDTGFTRWDLRQPDNYGEAGEDCVVMWTSGLWNDWPCTNKGGLMCDQDAVYDVSYPEVTPTLPPVYRCPNGWQTFRDNCYLIQSNVGNWQEARDQCRSMGADLASIDNSAENDYLAALVTQSGITGPLTHVWIGLNDLRVSLYFEWSDGSDVVFTYWNDNEPNNFLGANEDCVEMVGGGAWNDERCISRNPSICEMTKKIIEGTAPPVTSSGCDVGWVAYDSSCYGLTGKISADWTTAQSRCEDLGGKLASIKDRYEQTVVTSLLSSENGNPIWIGLNDLIVAGEYHWSDGTGVTYTNWDYLEPQENNGNCVAATSGLVAGLWQVKDCSSRYDYLCEVVRDGYTAAPTVTPPRNPTPPNDDNCADGWIGYGDKCFRVYDFGDKTRNMRTWQIALSQCRLVGGDLASFHSADEEDYIKNRIGNIENGFWIGLHDRSSETGFEWSDGSVVDYVAWDDGEPNNKGTIGEDCVELYFNGRGWNDKECTALRSWICQIDRGRVPINTPSPPPSLPSYTPCPTANDWVLEGDYCYYFSAGANVRLGWNDANAWCMQNGGYLTSIHSDDEQDKVFYYASTYTYTDHWIGIREYDIEGTYVWADKTPLDYQHWREGEPNDANGEEQCGEMRTTDGFWNDLNCGDYQPFICKRVYHETIPKTHAPTEPPTGYCPSGWDQYGYRCYKIYGYSQSERRSWYDGRDNCQVQGGDLVIIHSQEIQSFIISKMQEVGFPIYIGLSDITNRGQFRWVDGTPVDYTNWDGREPNEVGGEEDCVEMLFGYGEVGRWNDIGCDGSKGYICQRSIDEAYPQQPPDDNDCDTGYVPYYDSCFKLLTSTSDFATAAATCQNDGYYLASIHDEFEQAFVETLMYSKTGNPVWIGMREDNFGEFTWVDGWPTYYTNWAFQEPSDMPGEGCAIITAEGTWDNTRCSDNYGAVCKYTSLVKPTNPPDTPGTCPDNWIAYGNDCFLVRASPLDLASFPEAQFICRGYGAELASIHSSLENKLIFDAITITLTDVWLGMDRTLEGPFKWVDGTPVDYLNWAPSEPSYKNGDIDELCVEMYPGSGWWNDRECLQKQGFVCRASKYALNPTNPPVITGTKVTEPSGSTVKNTKGTAEQTGLSPGGIAGIVIAIIAVICLASVVIFFFITRKSSPSVAKTPGLPPSVGFDNALYSSGEKEGKVQIGSLDPTALDEQI